MALQRGADAALSNNEKEFIVKALRADQRLDGRGALEHRPLQFHFALDGSTCTVHLGQTRVLAAVTASLEAPYPDRPSEGSLRFSVDLPPMASPAFEAGRPGETAVELGRLVERGLRDSRAVDLEALCVQAGRRVWALRCDLAVLDHGGNLADACGLAALGALCSFRRPDATVDPGEGGTATVVIHPPSQREPLPLTIHHLPLPVTFALFDPGDLLAADPTLAEEAAASGSFTVTANPQGELCAVHKAHGAGVTPAQALRCARLAGARCAELAAHLRAALDAHEVARVAARVRRHAVADAPAPSALTAGAAAGAAADGRSVLVLRSGELPTARPSSGDAALPADIEQLVEHAAAVDSSEEEEDGDEGSEGSGMDEGSSSGEEEGADEEEDMPASPAAALPATAEEDKQDAAGAAAAQAAALAKEQRKRAKRQKTAAGDEDPYARIAELIVSAGAGAQAGGDLAAAVKRKP